MIQMVSRLGPWTLQTLLWLVAAPSAEETDGDNDAALARRDLLTELMAGPSEAFQGDADFMAMMTQYPRQF